MYEDSSILNERNYNSPNLFNSSECFTNSTMSSDSSETIDESYTVESIKTMKDALLQLIRKLESTIDFLKTELEEKNLLVKALIFQDANDGRKIDPALIYSPSPNISIESEITNCGSMSKTHTYDNDDCEEESFEELYERWIDFQLLEHPDNSEHTQPCHISGKLYEDISDGSIYYRFCGLGEALFWIWKQNSAQIWL